MSRAPQGHSARGWRLHVALALLLALAVHALTVWAIPRLIMHLIIDGAAAEARAGGRGLVYLPPPVDHTQRRIVMPSPDLLYASCAFDLGKGPLRVRFAADYPRYWSIALYAADSDTIFVVNDRQAGDQPVDLLLVTAADMDRAFEEPGGEQTGTHDAQRLVSPTRRGLLLLRLLVNDDPAVRSTAELTRRQLECRQGDPRSSR